MVWEWDWDFSLVVSLVVLVFEERGLEEGEAGRSSVMIVGFVSRRLKTLWAATFARVSSGDMLKSWPDVCAEKRRAGRTTKKSSWVYAPSRTCVAPLSRVVSVVGMEKFTTSLTTSMPRHTRSRLGSKTWPGSGYRVGCSSCFRRMAS